MWLRVALSFINMSLFSDFLSSKYLFFLPPLLVITVKNEGPFALWKGFFAQWIRIGPHTLTAFVVLEQLRRLLGMEAVGV